MFMMSHSAQDLSVSCKVNTNIFNQICKNNQSETSVTHCTEIAHNVFTCRVTARSCSLHSLIKHWFFTADEFMNYWYVDVWLIRHEDGYLSEQINLQIYFMISSSEEFFSKCLVAPTPSNIRFGPCTLWRIGLITGLLTLQTLSSIEGIQQQ